MHNSAPSERMHGMKRVLAFEIALLVFEKIGFNRL